MTEPTPTASEVPTSNFFAPALQPANREGLRFRLYRLLFHHEARDERNRGRVQVRCPQCSPTEHDDDAWFCRKCGKALPHMDNSAP